MEKGNILLCALAQFTIPDTNERGWNQVINTVYMIDDGEDVFDIHEMFLSNQTTDIRKVINYCIGQYISPKVLAGVNYYNKISNDYFTCPAKLGACLTTGASIGAMVCSYFDVNFFGGWNVLSPHSQNQNQVIQTIELGARFAYRFAHEE